MDEKEIVMVCLSRIWLQFSRAGAIVLDVAHRADHLEAADFIVKEFRKYIRETCQNEEIRENLEDSLQYIALHAIVPENRKLEKSRQPMGIRYSIYCINEVNKGIFLFTSLCKLGGVKLDMACIEHRRLLQLLREERFLYNRSFPWESPFIAGVRVIDIAVAIGYLEQEVTGQSEFLKLIGGGKVC